MADAAPISIRMRPKLSDVARLAGVGNATVSRVLNGGQNVSPETARRVEEIIRELGYKPNRAARSLKGAASGIIGMIVPSISDMFFSRCAEAVEEIVRENGGMLIVAASQNSSETILESFQQLMLHQIDGLILVQSSSQDQDLIEEITSAGIPVVGIDRPLDGTSFASVLCDNFEGARAGTAHLLEHGYAKVVSIEINSHLYTMRERHKGYVAAMQQAGKEPVSHVISCMADARLALQQEFRRDAGTLGLFAANNLSARYLLEAATTLRLHMPDELAVLSFDDFDLADLLKPPMSVVRQPVEDLGRQAARLLFRQMDAAVEGDTSSAASLSLPTQLVLRGSCGCPTATA